MRDFSSELRVSIQKYHDEIESSYLAKRIIRTEITRSEYCWLLSQLYYLHCALESSWQNNLGFSSLYDTSIHSRIPALKADLELLNEGNYYALHDSTVRLLAKFEEWNVTNHYSLIGALYVIEGSRLGGVLLKDLLYDALKLTNNEGAAYFLGTSEFWHKSWREFKRRISESPEMESHQELISNASIETFQGLTDLYNTRPFI